MAKFAQAVTSSSRPSSWTSSLPSWLPSSLPSFVLLDFPSWRSRRGYRAQSGAIDHTRFHSDSPTVTSRVFAWLNFLMIDELVSDFALSKSHTHQSQAQHSIAGHVTKSIWTCKGISPRAALFLQLPPSRTARLQERQTSVCRALAMSITAFNCTSDAHTLNTLSQRSSNDASVARMYSMLTRAMCSAPGA